MKSYISISSLTLLFLIMLTVDNTRALSDLKEIEASDEKGSGEESLDGSGTNALDEQTLNSSDAEGTGEHFTSLTDQSDFQAAADLINSGIEDGNDENVASGENTKDAHMF